MAPIQSSLDTHLLAVRSNELLMRGLAEAGSTAHMLMKREISHFTVETIAVEGRLVEIRRQSADCYSLLYPPPREPLG
ncbi:hypothetical protein RB598_002074 [Gaeumannomyces tritici]